ncbi:hypothetical protein J4467_00385 [Candidatus Woesearchaeota archaeon]|nr:hypothetical protein [Candidatus Woesearchaeota archaeon]
MVTYDHNQFREDPAKSEARKWVLNQLKNIFPSSRVSKRRARNGEGFKRPNLEALLLTGSTLAEVDEIFLPLGIQPRNIYGVDCSSDAFKLVKAENDRRDPKARINLFNEGVVDTFRRDEVTGIDIVSLDFDRNYGPTVIKTIRELFDYRNEVLADEVGLVINVQARRETSNLQRRLGLLNYSVDHVMASRLGALNYFISGREASKDDLGAIARYTALRFSEEFKGQGVVRNKFHLSDMRRALLQEVYMSALFPVLKTISFEEVIEYCENTWAHIPVVMHNVSSLKLVKQQIQPFLVGDDEFLSEPLLLVLASLVGGFEILYETVALKYLKESGNEKQFQTNPLSCGRLLATDDLFLGYDILDYAEYSYNSQSGAPMNTSFFHLRRGIADPKLKNVATKINEATRRATPKVLEKRLELNLGLTAKLNSIYSNSSNVEDQQRRVLELFNSEVGRSKDLTPAEKEILINLYKSDCQVYVEVSHHIGDSLRRMISWANITSEQMLRNPKVLSSVDSLSLGNLGVGRIADASQVLEDFELEITDEVSSGVIEPKVAKKYIRSRAELIAAIDEALPSLPETGRTRAFLGIYNVDQQFVNSLPAYIANRHPSRNKDSIPEKVAEPLKKSSTGLRANDYTVDEKAAIAATANRYGDKFAADTFGVSVSSIPALKAHITMETYSPVFVVRRNENLFVGKNPRLETIVDKLRQEHGNIIPDRVLEHHNIDFY